MLEKHFVTNQNVVTDVIRKYFVTNLIDQYLFLINVANITKQVFVKNVTN